VAWLVSVFGWVGDWSQRAALHKYADGAFGASGGGDERHFPDRAGRDLGSRRTFAARRKGGTVAALYGTYGNWLFTTLGAAMGTAAANPILSQGHHGKPWQERIAGAGFRSIAYSILLAVVLILRGLGRRQPGSAGKHS
jgi:hypothetical protein